MFRLIVVILCAYVAQAYVKDHAVNPTSAAQDDIIDKLTDKLVDRLFDSKHLSAWHLRDTDLHNTTLGFFPLHALAHLAKPMRDPWKNANNIAKSMPHATAACSAFAIAAAGDVFAQRLKPSGESEESEAKVDAQRAFAMASFAACWAVAFSVPWMELLGRAFGEGTTHAVLAKTAADKFIAMPLFGLPAFYAWTSTMRQHKPQEAMDRFKDTYVRTVKDSWVVGLPSALVLFSVIPHHLRVPVSSVFELAESTVVAMASNTQHSHAAPHANQAVSAPPALAPEQLVQVAATAAALQVAANAAPEKASQVPANLAATEPSSRSFLQSGRGNFLQTHQRHAMPLPMRFDIGKPQLGVPL